MTQRFNADNADRYGLHYEERSLWKKLRSVAATVGGKVLYPALQLYYVLQSDKVPIKSKTLIIGALGYLILPTDLVPDFIPALGFTDDLTALMVALRAVRKNITPEIKQRAKEETEKLIGK